MIRTLPDIAPIKPPREVKIFSSSAFACLLIAATPVIFALSTWNPSSEYSALLDWTSYLAIPVLAIEIAIILYAMSRGVEPLRPLANASRRTRATLALLVAVAIGTALGVAPAREIAVIRTSSTLIHLLFGLCTAQLLAGKLESLRDWLWPSIVAGCVGYVVVLALFVSRIQDPSSFEWVGFGLGVTHIRQTGFYCTVGAGAAIGLAIAARDIRKFFLWTIAASAFFGLSFWSGTRSSLLAVPAALGACWLFLPPARSARSIFALGGSIAFGALLSLVHAAPSPVYGWGRLFGSVAKESVNDLSTGRLTIWSGTLRVFLERPLFGFGESQFRYVVPESLEVFNHPHNSLIQLLLQWGLVGAICVLALASEQLRTFVRLSRERQEESLPAALVLAGLLAFSLYEGSLYHPYPVMMISLALAFVLGRGGSAELPSARPKR